MTDLPVIEEAVERQAEANPDNSPRWLANDLENISALICPWDHVLGADLWSKVLAGDKEAALSAMVMAHNQHRGRIVRVAYQANVPNRAFRELVNSCWNRDYAWMLHAAGGPAVRRLTLMQWFNRAKFNVSHLSVIVTAYRGVVLPHPWPWQMAANGFSWSLSQEVATFFASDYWQIRGAKGESVVVETRIDRLHIKATFDERKEQEIVVLARPDQLRGLKLAS